jgi:hypothetical protein
MYNKEEQVKANKKWRELNPDKWDEINRKQQAKHYENNKEKKIDYVCRRYWFKKEATRLMNILI